MKRIIWRRIGHQPGIRKLTASFNGCLYALDASNRLIFNDNFGLDPSWKFVQDIPANVVNLTCAASAIYYQTTDRALWYRNSHGEHVRAGQPWGAVVIAGTEDITLDFSILWALNDDKSLWQNANNGADGQWQHIGSPHEAVKIAAAHNVLYALNADGTFWVNESGGIDGGWECIGDARGAVEITAASQGQSSAIQLYALHADSSIWMGSVVSDCQVSLTTQDNYPLNNRKADWSSLSALDELGVTTNVWTIGGSHLGVNKNDGPDQFINIETETITSTFENYLSQYPNLQSNTTDLIVLDFEAPVLPPSWGQPKNKFRIINIFKALKTRIKIARSHLQNAKLSLHAVIAPDSQGNATKREFQFSLDGYRQAVDFGLFDELDYLSPVLYTRWGPADGCGAKGRLRYCTMAAYNRLGINETAALVNKPLAPMLSLIVNNPVSEDNTHLVNAEAAGAQLTYLQSRPEVARIIYWTAPKPENRKGNYVPPADILRFFRELEVCDE